MLTILFFVLASLIVFVIALVIHIMKDVEAESRDFKRSRSETSIIPNNESNTNK